MRERRLTLLTTVLALAFVTLLATPIAASAASGLSPTISIDPADAGPGSSVDVIGLDFSAGQVVGLRLITVEGEVGLGTATIGARGYFRETVTLPAQFAPGRWELRASATDGLIAVHLFDAGVASSGVAAAVVADATSSTEETAAAVSGNSATDILVMLVIALLIAGVGGGAALAWYQVHRDDQQPGMSTGEDPFWAGAHSEP